MNQKSMNTKKVVMTAFFAAITYLGIQSFRIPMPAAVGTPFLHFGHIFVVMGVLLQDGKRGAISGTTGLVLFDIINGYIHSIPEIFITTIIKCLVIGALFCYLNKKNENSSRQYHHAVICAILYGSMTVIFDLISSTLGLVIAGSSLPAAAIAAITSVPATVINALFMVVAISIVYLPVQSALKKTNLSVI